MMGALANMKMEVESLLTFLNDATTGSLKVPLTSAYCLTLGGDRDAAIDLLKKTTSARPDSKFAACLLNFFELVRGDDVSFDVLKEGAVSDDEAVKAFSLNSLDVLTKMQRIIQ